MDQEYQEFLTKEWVCGRKTAYKRPEWAEARLEHEIKCKHYDERYHVYACPYCTSWHIGRRPLKEITDGSRPY
jgi:hypothetical protein